MGNNYWNRKRVSRRKAIAGAAVAGSAIAALAVGCGDDDDDDGKGPAGSPQAASGQPKRGGDLVVPYTTGEHPIQDPHLFPAGGLHVFGTGIVYSRLLNRKLGAGIKGTQLTPEGDLAGSWEQPDETTYLFKLRPNAKWHNVAPVNGRQVTAQDVVYSMNRQRDLKITAGFLPAISSITAVDAQTVRLQSPKPDADFLMSMASVFLSVVAREAVEAGKGGDLKEGPNIGTSAWIFKEWVPNSTVKFVRNPDYYKMGEDGKSLPYADTLELPRISDFSTQQAAMRTGKAAALSFDKKTADLLVKENPKLGRVKFYLSGPFGGSSLVMKSNQAPLNDPRVRRAINLAFNRKLIVDTLWDGEGWDELNQSLVEVSSDDQLLPSAEVQRLVPFDLAQAKKLLEESGVRSYAPKLTVYFTDTAPGEFVREQLRAIGINATVDTMDNTTIARWFGLHDREIVALTRGNMVGSTNADLRTHYKTGGFINTSEMSDPEIDRLIEEQAVEVKDRAKRIRLLHDLQRKVLEFGAVTPYRGTVSHIVSQPNVRGFFASYPSLQESKGYEHVWFDR